MRIPGIAAAIVAISLSLQGCHKNIQNEQAVRDGIIKYLSKRTDLVSMDVTVTSVSFRKNEADATVHFQAKGTTDPGAGMQMKYVLEQKGDDWVVKGRSDMGGHGQNPQGGSESVPSGALPPGHPAIPTQPPPAGPQ